MYNLKDLADGYLGYIVCRIGETPLVGRAVLKVPAYLANLQGVNAAVDERVHLLGQSLVVTGVPFMQQDVRFANCAHAAAWVSLYSAYRHRRIGRVLIADVVAASEEFHPMSPTIPLGLEVREIRKLFRHFGLGVRTYDTPQTEHSDVPDFPGSMLRASKEEIALISRLVHTFRHPHQDEQTDAELAAHLESSWAVFKKRPGYFLDDAWITLSDSLKDTGFESIATEYLLLITLIDRMLELCVRPYIESGFPVYCSCGGEPHATILCGIAQDRAGDSVFYLHDDQYGPYLGTRTLLLASKSGFQYQSHTKTSMTSHGAEQLDGRSLPGNVTSTAVSVRRDVDRSVSCLVVATPPRLTLSPMAAHSSAYRIIAGLLRQGTETGKFCPLDYFDFRTLILTGLDYKRDRQRYFRTGSKPHKFFATFHLAEWVVLVEVWSRDAPHEEVRYEFVFDATSDDSHPLLQLARVGESLSGLHPHSKSTITNMALAADKLPPVRMPDEPSK